MSDDRADGPGWSIQPEAQIAVLVAQARQMVLDGDYEAAVGLAEELLDAHPDDTEMLLLLADLAPRYGHPEVGVLAALQVRELGGDVASVEAAALYATCELEEALTSAEERLRAAPEDARAHAVRGMVLEVVGRTAEADEALARAHALRPDAYPLPFPMADDDWEPMLLRAMSHLEPEERSRIQGWEFEWAPVPSVELLQTFPQTLPPSTFAIATAGDPPRCRLYTRNLARGCADEDTLLDRLIDALREQDEYLQDSL